MDFGAWHHYIKDSNENEGCHEQEKNKNYKKRSL